MNRPNNLKTKIFLDGGIPEETKEAIELLGFLDGQTTNPTLITKNPSFLTRQAKGKEYTEEGRWKNYKDIINEISPLVKNGSVSIEVYADRNTKAKEMVSKGLELFQWIPNAHIKLPITLEGLKAAEELVSKGVRVNMTLCFSQQQAAAVYSATKEAKKGDVFISPFVGRLDDKGKNGMSLTKNILKMYKSGDGHVEVLAASLRNLNHFLYSLKLATDIITAPISIFRAWKESGMKIPDKSYFYDQGSLTDIPYQEFDLGTDWKMFNIKHELTDKGIERFSKDWNTFIPKVNS